MSTKAAQPIPTRKRGSRLVQQWFRISAEQQNQLQSIARGLGVAPSTYARMAVKRALDENWNSIQSSSKNKQ